MVIQVFAMVLNSVEQKNLVPICILRLDLTVVGTARVQKISQYSFIHKLAKLTGFS